MKTIIQTGTILAVLLGLWLAGDASAQPALPTAPAGQTLDAWTFAGTNFLSFRHSAPISFTNVAPVPTWDGNGLQVDATNAAWIVYPVVQTNGHVELSCSHGSAEVWLSLDWNSSDGLGDWGTVLEVGNWNTNLSGATGAWGLYISPDGGSLCFSAQTNGASTNYLTAPISWNAGEWHQIVLTYSATNTALYLEGQLVTNGLGLSIVPDANVLSNGFSIGSDGLGTGLLQSRAVYNQLITYNYELDADTISNNYAYDIESVYPLPSSGGRLHTGGLQTDSLPSLPPAPGGGGTNSGGGPTFNSPNYTTNDFWLEALSLGTNAYNSDPNSLTLILHGTIADIDYQILSTTNLQTSNTIWTLEEDVIGSETTNFTAATVHLGTEPQKFFKALAYTLDTTGDGLPDWWQQKYFGYVGVDPFANPMGDGYDNLYKYEHGMNPNTFYTPSPPAGVSAILNTNGNVIISWPASANLPNTGAGAVTGYTIQIQNDGSTNLVNLGSNSLFYETNLASDLTLKDYLFFPDYTPFVTGYALRVNYAHTNSLWSGLQVSFDPTCSVNAAVARGPGGVLYLTVSAVPANVVALRIATQSYIPTYPINTYADSPGINDFGDVESFSPDFQSNTNSSWPVPYFDVPVANLSNGIYQIPPSKVPLFGLYSFTVMGIGANGNLGTPVIASPTNEWDQAEYIVFFGPHTPNVPFFDGRTNIAQNINMFLRGADSTQPFVLGLDRTNFSGELNWSYTIAQQTNYVWDGFCFQNHGLDDDAVYEQRNEFQPFEETSLFTNLIFNLNLFDSLGNFNNQVSVNFSENEELDLINPNKLFDTYNYIANNPTLPLSTLPSAVLDQTTENWICSPGNAYEVLTSNGGNSFTLPFTAKNIYGLSYQGLKYFGSGDTWSVASPGNTFSLGNFNFAQNVAAPVLFTEGYYFARPLVDPMPGQSTFSVTNATPPVMIMPFGKQFYLTAWAKQSVLNGYSGVYAFPQQYFDKAYMADANGNITTNQTGILSEYGDFFPTRPGKMFLTTKPDAATGSVGTNVVNVIKLQVDANHDGVMDLSFAGPDNTSADRPFNFWVNNDRDYSSKPSDPGKDITTDTNHCDYTLQNIPSQRDLEDWTRLWICGLPDLPTNYDVTLSWNVISGTPAINLARAYETNGGTLYLTDTNIAAEQAGGTGAFVPSYKIALLTSNAIFNIRPYLNSNPTNCFLFEGAGIGKAELILTVSQGATNIASTSVFVDFHDIKDFYERSHTTNYDLEPPTTKVSSYLIDYTPPIAATEDTNIIVFVHGLNTSYFDYVNTSETMFKRLYWQGYRGRFAAFRWPSPLFKIVPTGSNDITYLGFNEGEFISFHSGAALKGYLGTLTSRFTGYTINLAVHSLGNIAANEAIREGAHVDNYALMQAAVSAKAFDGDDTNLDYSFLVNQEANTATPDADALGGYDNCFTNMTRRVNFYNDDDWALAKGPGQMWEGNQHDFKPDHSLTLPGYYYLFDGTNCSLWLTSETGVTLSRTLTDGFEKKAYVARSRSKAVGAAGLKYAPFAVTSGAINLNVSLQDATKGFVGGAQFGNTRPEHSGEFTKPIQNAVPFYKHLLSDGFQIVPDP